MPWAGLSRPFRARSATTHCQTCRWLSGGRSCYGDNHFHSMLPPLRNPSQRHPGVAPTSEYQTMSETTGQSVEKHRVIGLYTNRRISPPEPPVQLTSQHAGPMLTGYIAKTTIATAVHLAHRSRRLMIRTVSQRPNATNDTPSAGRTSAITVLEPIGPHEGHCLWTGYSSIVIILSASRRHSPIVGKIPN
jgi:hypothetical protein